MRRLRRRPKKIYSFTQFRPTVSVGVVNSNGFRMRPVTYSCFRTPEFTLSLHVDDDVVAEEDRQEPARDNIVLVKPQ